MTYGLVRVFGYVFAFFDFYKQLMFKQNPAEIRSFCMCDLSGKATYGLTAQF